MFFSVIAACSGSDRPEVETLDFSVDSTLLGESFADSAAGLFLKVPAGWRRLSEATVKQVQTSIEVVSGDTELPVPWILALFSLQEHNAHLVVGRYDPRLLPADRNSLLIWQKEELEGQFPESEVSFARFKHNGILFEQLLVAGAEFTVIKLFIRCEGRGIYQFEYVASRSWYEANLQSIESSIGSITFGS